MKFTYWQLKNKILVISILALLISSFIVYFSMYHYSMGKTKVTIKYESDIAFAAEEITVDEDFLLTHIYLDEDGKEITYKMQLTEQDVKNIFSSFVRKGYFLNFKKYTRISTYDAKKSRIRYPGNSYLTIAYNGKEKTIGGYNAIYMKSFYKYYKYLIEYIDEFK